MGINIQLQHKDKPTQRKPFEIMTPYDKRYGFWGTVTEVHPENCTVNVRMDTGQVIANVRVASLEWVTVVKDKPLTGERHLPPVDTFVFCMMPNGEINSSFVLCSGFAMAEAVHADFKKEGEDAANTWEKIENSGWKKTIDYRTGTMSLKNKPEDETISLDIDQENEGKEDVKLTIHGTVTTINKDDGIVIETDKKMQVMDKEGFSYSTEGKIELKSSKAETLELGNTVATLGAMISSLLEFLSSSDPITYGSPASHMFLPTFIAKITALKTKWEQVFK